MSYPCIPEGSRSGAKTYAVAQYSDQAGGTALPGRIMSAAGTEIGRETIAYAASRGIAADELPLVVNGCSGGISKLYALGGKSISCEQCCNMHDIDYQLGGSRKDRRETDRRLRQCACRAGLFPPGVTGAARKLWRLFRAWMMWLFVRAFGWWAWAK